MFPDSGRSPVFIGFIITISPGLNEGNILYPVAGNSTELPDSRTDKIIPISTFLIYISISEPIQDYKYMLKVERVEEIPTFDQIELEREIV